MRRGQKLQRRVKIIATLGPATQSRSMIEKLIKAGIDGARISFSRGNEELGVEMLENLRSVAQQQKRSIAAMYNMTGVELRVGVIPGVGLDLFEEKYVWLQSGVTSTEAGVIPVPYDRFAHDMSVGDRIIVDNGSKELEVREVKGQRVRAKVLRGGRLLSYKRLHVPTQQTTMMTMTQADKEELAFALKQGIDFVVSSFISSAEDAKTLRRMIGKMIGSLSLPAIIAKVQTEEALRNYAQILEQVDGVLLARSELGMTALETQQQLAHLVAQGVISGKPVMVGTHILESMQMNSKPLWIEESEVAAIVGSNVDAVVLNDETAAGQYPAKTVEVLARLVTEAKVTPLDMLLPQRGASGEPVHSAVAAAAVELARHISAAAILVTTRSGYTARQVARFRPERPIFAATDVAEISQQLLVTWGVHPLNLAGYDRPEEMVKGAIALMQKSGLVKKDERVVVVSGLQAHSGKGYDSNVRVLEV